MGKTVDALLKLGVEGASEFQNTLKRETQEVSRLKDEYKVLATGFSDADKSANRFQKQTEALTRVLQAQRKKQQEIQDIIEKLANSTSDADKETDEYKTTMDALQKQLNKATVEANKTEREIEKLGTATEEASDATESAEFNMKDLGAMMVGASAAGKLLADAVKSIGRAMIDAGKAAVQYNMSLEKSQKGLEAFIGADGADKMVSRMKKLTKQTGISTASLLQQAQTLTAVGVSGDDAADTIEGMSKVIMALGGDNATFERMLTNMQGIQTAGAATTQDMKQFKTAGIPVMQMLEKSTGKTAEQLEEMGKKGQITFEMISTAFQQAAEEGGMYYDAIQAGAETLDGKLNVLKATIEDDLGTAFAPAADVLRDTLVPYAQQLVDNIDWNKVAEAMGKVAEGAANFVTSFANNKEWELAMLQISTFWDKMSTSEFGQGMAAFFTWFSENVKKQQEETAYYAEVELETQKRVALGMEESEARKQAAAEVTQRKRNEAAQQAADAEMQAALMTEQGQAAAAARAAEKQKNEEAGVTEFHARETAKRKQQIEEYEQYNAEVSSTVGRDWNKSAEEASKANQRFAAESLHNLEVPESAGTSWSDLFLGITTGSVSMEKDVSGAVKGMREESGKTGKFEENWDKAFQGIPTEAGKAKEGTAAEFSALVKNGSVWGSHFVYNFAQGISGNLGVLDKAAKDAASTVAKYMEHTVPDEGPLASEMEWMPHMMKNLSAGIEDNIWRVEDAAKDMAQAIANPVTNATTNNDNRTISMTINGAPGQDAEELADYVIYRLGVDTDRRMRN